MVQRADILVSRRREVGDHRSWTTAPQISSSCAAPACPCAAPATTTQAREPQQPSGFHAARGVVDQLPEHVRVDFQADHRRAVWPRHRRLLLVEIRDVAADQDVAVLELSAQQRVREPPARGYPGGRSPRSMNVSIGISEKTGSRRSRDAVIDRTGISRHLRALGHQRI
jgi:hypothetical protein